MKLPISLVVASATMALALCGCDPDEVSVTMDVSPCLTPTSPALMCLYHVDRRGMRRPGISSFMWQGASYGESFSSTTCLLKRTAIWFVTSILVPLFALFSLTTSCALKGSYSAYLRRRLSFGSGTAAPCRPAQVFAPPGLVAQAVLRGELAERDPASGVDGRVPVRGEGLPLLESQVCSRHVLCDILSHCVLSSGLMVGFGSFHLTRDCGAFVVFSRDDP